MTDAPPRKRRWFQFHLSTCVVLMILVATLMYGNLSGRLVMYGFVFPEITAAPNGMRPAYVDANEEWWDWGWPFACYTLRRTGSIEEVYIQYPLLTVNIITTLSLLAATVLACEKVARERGATKGGEA